MAAPGRTINRSLFRPGPGGSRAGTQLYRRQGPGLLLSVVVWDPIIRAGTSTPTLHTRLLLNASPCNPNICTPLFGSNSLPKRRACGVTKDSNALRMIVAAFGPLNRICNVRDFFRQCDSHYCAVRRDMMGKLEVAKIPARTRASSATRPIIMDKARPLGPGVSAPWDLQRGSSV